MLRARMERSGLVAFYVAVLCAGALPPVPSSGTRGAAARNPPPVPPERIGLLRPPASANHGKPSAPVPRARVSPPRSRTETGTSPPWPTRNVLRGGGGEEGGGCCRDGEAPPTPPREGLSGTSEVTSAGGGGCGCGAGGCGKPQSPQVVARRRDGTAEEDEEDPSSDPLEEDPPIPKDEDGGLGGRLSLVREIVRARHVAHLRRHPQDIFGEAPERAERWLKRTVGRVMYRLQTDPEVRALPPTRPGDLVRGLMEGLSSEEAFELVCGAEASAALLQKESPRTVTPGIQPPPVQGGGEHREQGGDEEELRKEWEVFLAQLGETGRGRAAGDGGGVQGGGGRWGLWREGCWSCLPGKMQNWRKRGKW